MKREKRWLLNNGEYSLIKLNNYSWKVIVNYELKISLYSDRSCLTKTYSKYHSNGESFKTIPCNLETKC